MDTITEQIDDQNARQYPGSGAEVTDVDDALTDAAEESEGISGLEERE